MTDQHFQQLLTTLIDVFRSVPQLHSQQWTSSTVDPARHFDLIAARVAQFSYGPEANLTFEAWFRRHEDIFQVDGQTLDDATRVRLLLHKIDASAYEKYSSYILQRAPRDVTFNEAESTLMDLFGPQQSLFSECMKLRKDPNDDFVTYAERVNRECEKFKLADCNHNQFKCLIFVCGLQSSDDVFIRLKLLDKIEADPKCTIQTLTEECKRLLNLKHDTKMIEDGSTRVQAVKRSPPHQPGRPSNSPHHPCNNKQPSKKATSIPSALQSSLLRHAGSVKQCTSFATATVANIDALTVTGLVTKMDSADQPDVEQSSLDPLAQRGKPHAPTQYPRFQASTAVNTATITVDGQPISFQVDTASDVTIINNTTWELMGKPELQPPSLITHSASGDRIHFIGQRQCTYSFNDASAQGKFYVSNNPSNLLGAEWISNLGICSIMDSLPCSDPGNPTMIKRALLKLKEEGTLSENLQTFLLNYRSTPCASVDGARSSAELFVGRKLRTSLSILKPTLRRAPTHNTSMESQFNKQYGARKRYFRKGDAVLVRLYNGKHPNWCNGEVLQRIGRVQYKVLVGDTSWIRHANQLRMRTYDGKHTAQQDLDVVMLDLERLPPTPPPAHHLHPYLRNNTLFSKHNRKRTRIIYDDQLVYDKQRDDCTWIHRRSHT